MFVLQSPLTSPPCCNGVRTLIARLVEFVTEPDLAVMVTEDKAAGVFEPVVIFRVARQMSVQERAAGLKRHFVFDGMIVHDMSMKASDWEVPVSCLSVIVAYAEPPCTTDMSPELKRENLCDDVKNSTIGVAFESLVVSGGRSQRVSMVASAE